MSEVIEVQVSGDTKSIKRAISSAKDVLYGVPKQETEREVKASVVSDDIILVENGEKEVIPSGEYKVKSVGYKYVKILHPLGDMKVEAAPINKVKVEKSD